VFRNEAADEMLMIEKEKMKKKEELEFMRKEIEKGTPLLKGIKRLTQAGIQVEEVMFVKEEVTK
jgi:hypothetical protein